MSSDKRDYKKGKDHYSVFYIEADEVIKKVDEMGKKKEDIESRIAVVSEALVTFPDEDPIIEAAPLHALIADLLIEAVQLRGEEGDETELDEDDMQAAWDNLEAARFLYKNAKDGKNYDKELSDICASSSQILMENQDFEGAITDLKECLELRKKCNEENSRPIADAFFSLGIAYYYSAQNDALNSEDDPTLKEKAMQDVQESVASLNHTIAIFKQILIKVAVDAKVVVKGERDEETLATIMASEKLTKEMKDLVDLIEDIETNVKEYSGFNVDTFLKENREGLDELKRMMKEDGIDDEDEEDEDFEEEEEDGDDIVIDNTLKREHEEKEEGAKKRKM